LIQLLVTENSHAEAATQKHIIEQPYDFGIEMNDFLIIGRPALIAKH